jgi:hypothetical protein
MCLDIGAHVNKYDLLFRNVFTCATLPQRAFVMQSARTVNQVLIESKDDPMCDIIVDRPYGTCSHREIRRIVASPQAVPSPGPRDSSLDD